MNENTKSVDTVLVDGTPATVTIQPYMLNPERAEVDVTITETGYRISSYFWSDFIRTKFGINLDGGTGLAISAEAKAAVVAELTPVAERFSDDGYRLPGAPRSAGPLRGGPFD